MAASRRGVGGWLAERLPVRPEIFAYLAREPIPAHMRLWWFALGGTPLICFAIQIITGILLTFYYIPNPEYAYHSVERISHEVPFGWWVRSLHNWSANLMIATMMLHMVRVFFTCAYRRPRELQWCVGACICLTVLGLGFTGYALIYDQISYWAATVGTNIAGKVPLVGPLVRLVMLGGERVNPTTLTRFFDFHIGVLPTILVALIAVHVYLIRTLGVSTLQEDPQDPLAPQGRVDEEADELAHEKHGFFLFYPHHMLTELIAGLMILLILCELAIVYPAHLGPPADPATTPAHIKPEWYFYAAFQMLKIFPEALAIGLQGLILAAFILWPFIDRLFLRAGKRYLSVWLGGAGVVMFILLTLREAFAGLMLLPGRSLW